MAQEIIWSPDSQLLLACLRSGQGLFMNLQGRVLNTCSLGSRVVQLASWGPSGVVALGTPRRMHSAELAWLLVYTVSQTPGLDGQLVPRLKSQHHLSIGPGLHHWCRPVISPDGCHVALCTYWPVDEGTRFVDKLLVWGFKDRRLQTYDLQPWPGETASQADFEACWAPVSGASLVVTNFAGTLQQQLHFA